jgi:hypothetical protein
LVSGKVRGYTVLFFCLAIQNRYILAVGSCGWVYPLCCNKEMSN